jgi:aconitate hydratase 2/2-methylisocitrate dehydratase
MLKQFGGEMFSGSNYRVHLGTLTADQLYLTDLTAEMKAKASICISEDDTLIKSLEIAQGRIQIMIDGMDNEKQVLKGLIAIANNRIEEIKSGTKPALT